MRETIYVKLLDEGVDVWRPVIAENKGSSFFILPPPHNQMPSSENWEFPIGSHVLVKETVLEGKPANIACALAGN